MTDIVGEIYGKKIAKLFVLAGAISIILFLVYSLVSVITPWADQGLGLKSAYNQVFGLSARISIASVLAFIIAEYQDVISFFFFRKKTRGKYFWIYSNISNIWSQLLDTIVFMFVAFLGIYSIHTILLIIIPWWIFKVLMGFLYTPISYLGVYLLKKE